MFKRNLIQSFKHAIYGLKFVLRHERNMRTHCLAAALAVGLGAYLQISKIEWLFIIMSITIVFIAESINTAFELLLDYANRKKYHATVKIFKDIAAGGVLIAVTNSLIAACVIFIPRLKECLK